jgi:hypothetical protein
MPRAIVFRLVGCSLVSLAACSPPEPPPPPGERPPQSTPFVAPGVRCPPVRPADDASVADDAEVVGVGVAGRARAYLLKALAPTTSHVVNDLVADVPVTVTYCDRTGCVRAFTDNSRGNPLDVWAGGYHNGLLLKIGPVFFQQDSGESLSPGQKFPYRRLEYQRTTWKAWKAAHPDTEIFTGR